MRTILAFVLALITHAAPAAYTYTYTNSIFTVNHLFIAGEELTEDGGLHTISFSMLLDNKILPNTSYQFSDLLATSWKDIGGYSSSDTYLSILYPYTSVSFQTDGNGFISDWDLHVGAGNFSMISTRGHDLVSTNISVAYNFGETSNIGSWKEQPVTYSPGADLTYYVSPIPEPQSYGMLLLGLVVVSLVANKKFYSH